MKLFLSTLLTVSTLALTTQAADLKTQDTTDPKYFEIADVAVTQVVTDHALPVSINHLAVLQKEASPTGWIANDLTAELDVADVALDKIINIGKKVWAIVELGRPVADYHVDAATALPFGATDWKQLESWQPLRSSTWQISYKNGYGAEVVNFQYKVLYLSGGSVKGHGKYIGYAIVQPSKLDVAWGFKFNAEASAPVVYNMGTSDDPIGAMTLNIKWSVDTVMKHSERTEVYNVTGLGQITRM